MSRLVRLMARCLRLWLSNMNTVIEYLYRDADNYKQNIALGLPGTFSDSDKETVKQKLDGGMYFIPSQVGLPDLQEQNVNGIDPEVDHAWHEWDWAWIEDTDQEPNYNLSVTKLVENFKDVVWDEKTAIEELIDEGT